jgi:histidine triad (HIT) family protein
MSDGIFTKIVSGEIPCHKVFEDDKTLAFLDIHPVAPGMTLVVTKNQVANFEDLQDTDYDALWNTVRKVARRQREIFPDCRKVAVQVEGLDMPEYAHVKVFPIHSIDDLTNKVDMTATPDHQALNIMTERLAF